MTTDPLTLETADVEWLASTEPGSMLVAYVGLYRVHLGHDGECWRWRLDLLGEGPPIEQVDGANGLISGSLGKAQARAVEIARMLSLLVEGVDVQAHPPNPWPYKDEYFNGPTLVLPNEGLCLRVSDAWRVDAKLTCEFRAVESVTISRAGERCAPEPSDAHQAAIGAIHAAVSWLVDLGADSTKNNAGCIELLAAHTVPEYAVKHGGNIGTPSSEPTPSSGPREMPRWSEALRLIGSDSVWTDTGRWLTSVGYVDAADIQVMLAEFFSDLGSGPRETAMLCAEAYGADRDCTECQRVVRGCVEGKGELLVCVKHYDPTPAVDVEALREIVAEMGRHATLGILERERIAIGDWWTRGIDALGDAPSIPTAEPDAAKAEVDRWVESYHDLQAELAEECDAIQSRLTTLAGAATIGAEGLTGLCVSMRRAAEDGDLRALARAKSVEPLIASLRAAVAAAKNGLE